ncbi:hypothetical protein [Massilia sp. DJPM01]|uniref:hypothetical protein n=1 Tax=Massilia sp. DJPM01 TaxID=3024404 RepID=UPI0035A2D3CA
MLRVLLIQQLFNLSGEEMEFQSTGHLRSAARKTPARAGPGNMQVLLWLQDIGQCRQALQSWFSARSR